MTREELQNLLNELFRAGRNFELVLPNDGDLIKDKILKEFDKLRAQASWARFD